MRIAIDGIAMSNPQPGGYHTYTTNLVRALAAVDRSNEYTLLVDRPVALEAGSNWRVMIAPARIRGIGVAWREQVALRRLLWREKADVFHAPAATGPLWVGIPTVVTLYDDIEFSDPLPPLGQPRRWAMRVYSRAVQRAISTRASRVVTISEYSKRGIISRFGLPTSKVTTVHLAASAVYRPLEPGEAEQRVWEGLGISDYVLGFASAAERKNVRGLLQAYALLAPELRQRHRLALVCTHGEARSRASAQAEALGLMGSLTLVDHVSDERLLDLYNAARVFVFPSLEEGFGLPPLEAMACGTPVIASNTSSMPEVLGDAALLVPPTDADALADAMAAVLTQPGLAQDLGERGLARARLFSWEETARRTLMVYDAVAAASC